VLTRSLAQFSLLGPIIPAAAAIVVAIISAVWAARTSRRTQAYAAGTQAELEHLKSRLAAESVEHKSRDRTTSTRPGSASTQLVSHCSFN
jgi:hypothetical protein